MAISSFFALLDDIATVMDDVAVLSKVAAQKTSAVLGDDLALNSQQLIGLSASREIPVVLAVARGSLLNKIIIVPLALLISAILPWLVLPLLMIGGIYLCFEGAEKVLHGFFSRWNKKEADKSHEKHLENILKTPEELLLFERDKIKGAIRTDFILSAEIIVISLGIVASYPLLTRCLVLSGISIFMTVGVYGLVAFIVKLDDLGLYFLNKSNPRLKFKWLGKFLLFFAPNLMKFLSIAGTIAMFLVGGGIVLHGLPFIHHFIDGFFASNLILKNLFQLICEGLLGFSIGTFFVGILHFVKSYFLTTNSLEK